MSKISYGAQAKALALIRKYAKIKKSTGKHEWGDLGEAFEKLYRETAGEVRNAYQNKTAGKDELFDSINAIETVYDHYFKLGPNAYDHVNGNHHWQQLLQQENPIPKLESGGGMGNETTVTLQAPIIGDKPEKIYAAVLDINREEPFKSILRIEEKYNGQWIKTPGQWYLGTLMGIDGFYGSALGSDTIALDAGQGWYVTGIKQAVNQAANKIGITEEIKLEKGGNLTVPNTIKEQIGSKALYMLGAKNLVGDKNSLSFRIRGSNKANYIKITLDANDTYTVEFGKVRTPRASLKTLHMTPEEYMAAGYKVVAKHSGVYDNMLHKIIEKETGLYTKLFQDGGPTDKQEEWHIFKKVFEIVNKENVVIGSFAENNELSKEDAEESAKLQLRMRYPHTWRDYKLQYAGEQAQLFGSGGQTKKVLLLSKYEPGELKYKPGDIVYVFQHHQNPAARGRRATKAEIAEYKTVAPKYVVGNEKDNNVQKWSKVQIIEPIFDEKYNERYRVKQLDGYRLEKEFVANQNQMSKSNAHPIAIGYSDYEGEDKDRFNNGGKFKNAFGPFKKESVKNIIKNEGILYAIQNFIFEDDIHNQEAELREYWADARQQLKVFEKIMQQHGFNPGLLVYSNPTGYAVIVEEPYREIPATELPRFLSEKIMSIDHVLKKIMNYVGLDEADFGKEFKSGGQFKQLCPVGTEIQTLLFSHEHFKNEDYAKAWAQKHNFKYGNVEEGAEYWRIRQQEPENFKQTSFRTITLTDGVKAVIGCPKHKNKMEDGGKTTSRAQFIDNLHPLDLWKQFYDGRWYRKFLFKPTDNYRIVADMGIKERIEEKNDRVYVTISVANDAAARQISDLFMKEFPAHFADGGAISEGENGYVAFYKGKRTELRADSIYQAQQKAQKYFNAKHGWDVNVVLATEGNKQVVHVPDFATGGTVSEQEQRKIEAIENRLAAAVGEAPIGDRVYMAVKFKTKTADGYIFGLTSHSDYPVNRATPKLERLGIKIERVGEKGKRNITIPESVFRRLTATIMQTGGSTAQARYFDIIDSNAGAFGQIEVSADLNDEEALKEAFRKLRVRYPEGISSFELKPAPGKKYFETGGEMESRGKGVAFYNTDWVHKAIETYGKKFWNKLSPEEKEMVLAEQEKAWERSWSFAQGGGVPPAGAPQPNNLTSQEMVNAARELLDLLVLIFTEAKKHGEDIQQYRKSAPPLLVKRLNMPKEVAQGFINAAIEKVEHKMEQGGPVDGLYKQLNKLQEEYTTLINLPENKAKKRHLVDKEKWNAIQALRKKIDEAEEEIEESAPPVEERTGFLKPGEREPYWTAEARKRLLGKKVVRAQLMKPDTAEALGWENSGDCLLIQFNDGTVIYPSQDDEGNGPGFFAFMGDLLETKEGQYPPPALYGSKVANIYYALPELIKDYSWNSRPIVILFENTHGGTIICTTQSDPEGNDGGAIFGQKGKDDFVLPVL